jgi:hypothetical protein
MSSTSPVTAAAIRVDNFFSLEVVVRVIVLLNEVPALVVLRKRKCDTHRFSTRPSAQRLRRSLGPAFRAARSVRRVGGAVCAAAVMKERKKDLRKIYALLYFLSYRGQRCSCHDCAVAVKPSSQPKPSAPCRRRSCSRRRRRRRRSPWRVPRTPSPDERHRKKQANRSIRRAPNQHGIARRPRSCARRVPCQRGLRGQPFGTGQLAELPVAGHTCVCMYMHVYARVRAAHLSRHVAAVRVVVLVNGALVVKVARQVAHDLRAKYTQTHTHTHAHTHTHTYIPSVSNTRIPAHTRYARATRKPGRPRHTHRCAQSPIPASPPSPAQLCPHARFSTARGCLATPPPHGPRPRSFCCQAWSTTSLATEPFVASAHSRPPSAAPAAPASAPGRRRRHRRRRRTGLARLAAQWPCPRRRHSPRRRPVICESAASTPSQLTTAHGARSLPLLKTQKQPWRPDLIDRRNSPIRIQASNV